MDGYLGVLVADVGSGGGASSKGTPENTLYFQHSSFWFALAVHHARNCLSRYVVASSQHSATTMQLVHMCNVIVVTSTYALQLVHCGHSGRWSGGGTLHLES